MLIGFISHPEPEYTHKYNWRELYLSLSLSPLGAQIQEGEANTFLAPHRWTPALDRLVNEHLDDQERRERESRSSLASGGSPPLTAGADLSSDRSSRRTQYLRPRSVLINSTHDSRTRALQGAVAPQKWAVIDIWPHDRRMNIMSITRINHVPHIINVPHRKLFITVKEYPNRLFVPHVNKAHTREFFIFDSAKVFHALCTMQSFSHYPRPILRICLSCNQTQFIFVAHILAA